MAKHEDVQRVFKRRIVSKQDILLSLLVLINLGTFLILAHPFYMPLLIKYGLIK